jgi:phosphate transport system permease protein
MKKIEEYVALALMQLATFIIVGSFFLVVFVIVKNGYSYLSWDLISKTPEGGFYIGEGGGVLNAILGSFYIAAGSSLLALLLSIPIVIYMNVYLKRNNWISNVTRLSFDVLFGIPSIVYGAFGFTVMMYFGIKTSLLGGLFAVTLLVIPIMVRALDEVVQNIPKEMLEATFSLGATRFETIGVVLRQTAPGMLTAILLSFGRGIGDVASVMFTAGFSDNIPTSLDSAAATLPLAVFFQLSSYMEVVQGRAYATALLLTIMVLMISIAARFFSKKFSKNKV